MGNCAQRLGRDCGFKYQQYYGQNPEELDQYLREKIKAKYEIRFSNRNVFIGGISEKSPEFEEDSLQLDEKTTQNQKSQANILTWEPRMERSLEIVGERCETKKLDHFRVKHLIHEEPLKIPQKNHMITEAIKNSPLLSNSPDKTSKKRTPDRRFEFQNKIFDFKEIQSPNILFKDYGTIFNDDEDEFSDGVAEKEGKFSGISGKQRKPNNEKVI